MAPSPPSSHLVLAAIEPGVGNGIVKCSGGTVHISLFWDYDSYVCFLWMAEVCGGYGWQKIRKICSQLFVCLTTM